MTEKNLPATNDVADENIIDVDLSAIKKQKFRINGDNNKILELNTSDMGLMTRLDEMYPKLIDLQNEVISLADENDGADDTSLLSSTAKKLKKIDNDMRETLDYIFQANVSETCGSEGSMYDPIDGVFRYEHIIETLTKLYENNLNNEFQKMKARVDKLASKHRAVKKRK